MFQMIKAHVSNTIKLLPLSNLALTEFIWSASEQVPQLTRGPGNLTRHHLSIDQPPSASSDQAWDMRHSCDWWEQLCCDLFWFFMTGVDKASVTYFCEIFRVSGGSVILLLLDLSESRDRKLNCVSSTMTEALPSTFTIFLFLFWNAKEKPPFLK